MTHPNYTRDLLKNSSRGELHEICTLLSIPRRRSIQDCIADILAAQPQPVVEKSIAKPQDPNFEANYEKAIAAGFEFRYTEKGWKGLNNGMRYVATLGRYAVWDATISTTASLAAGYLGSPLHQRHLREAAAVVDEQTVAQAEFVAHIEEQADVIAPEQQRLEMNQKGYRDAVEGLASQSNDPCYRVGYERGVRDVSPVPVKDLGSEAIAFDKIGSTIYGGVWEAIVNDVKIRIVSVAGGYKTNLTGDAMLVDFGIAIKESLLAVARIQAQPEKPALEVFATTRPNIFAVYSHKSGFESKRYEVDLNAQTCTCPHYEHRHSLEGFKDKHIEAVRAALLVGTTPLPIEEEMLLNKPFDELTATDWERICEPELELIAA